MTKYGSDTQRPPINRSLAMCACLERANEYAIPERKKTLTWALRHEFFK